jgi:hypothetical protein
LYDTFDLGLQTLADAIQEICQAPIVRLFFNTTASLMDVTKIFEICFHKLYVLFQTVPLPFPSVSDFAILMILGKKE